MKYFSTRDRTRASSLKDAVLSGLAPDGGLYMPEELPVTSFSDLSDKNLQEIASLIGYPFVASDMLETDFQDLVVRAFPFDAPVVRLSDDLFILELFHGPTLAFKDFGARFMAQLMSHLIRNDDETLTVLVATSGDTGSAVASGFLGVPGIEVVILYPEGKVSSFQEKQLTTCGQNITALKVKGNFDDCQKMVKDAFLNEELRAKKRLTSANSINIARLLPQSFYYFRALAQCNPSDWPVTFSVPSGNFGNLTAGLFAMKMGAPIAHFLAATNENNIVPNYLDTGVFEPRSSRQTLSNAMDVGNPSNFERMKELLGDEAADFSKHMSGYWFSDEDTIAGITKYQKQYNYFTCPHTAIGALALENHGKKGIALATAHPIKFAEELSKAGVDTSSLEIPERLKKVIEGESKVIHFEASSKMLVDYLLSR